MYRQPELISAPPMRALAFSPKQLGVISRARPDGTVDPLTIHEMLSAHGDEIWGAIDGPMFEACPRADGFTATCALPSFGAYDSRRELSLRSQNPQLGMTISVVGNLAIPRPGFSPVPFARTAVQLYPTLVWEGDTVSVAESNPDTRAALAILRDGRLALVISQQMTMAQFASALTRLGAVYAGYTDGGSSTAMAESDGTHGSDRPVAMWLVVERSNIWPTRKKVAYGIAATLALAAGAYAWPEIEAELKKWSR